MSLLTQLHTTQFVKDVAHFTKRAVFRYATHEDCLGGSSISKFIIEIIPTRSRWYDFDYEFRDAATAQTIFMGSIPKYSSFREVCDIFHKLGGVKLCQEGHKVIITAN